MKIKTRSGVKEARQLSLTGDEYTVENLNPQSRAVKSLEMAIKRAVVLSEVIDKHVQQVGAEKAGSLPPERWYLKDADLTEIWGKGWKHHPEYVAWPITYALWVTGGLRRSVEDAMLCLPTESRDKVAELVRKRYKMEPDDD